MSDLIGTGRLAAKIPHPGHHVPMVGGDVGSSPGTAVLRGPVLWLFDNLVIAKRAHDVAAACRLAMADVRVRLPLGALVSGRGKAWQSACFGRTRPLVQIQPS